MLHEFLRANRGELIDRCRRKVVRRRAPLPTDTELEHGIPYFLDQLVRTLEVEQTANPMEAEMSVTAARHGRELLQQGFTIDQVVHDYGDLCQAITDLAVEREAAVPVNEFRTLNRCLDNAIADSVMEFSFQRDLLLADSGAHALNERLGFLAHELRSLIQTATLARTAIKSGNVGVAGATGAVLDRSLVALRNVVDRSLADVRVTAGLPVRQEVILLSGFITQVRITAALEAQARGCGFTVAPVERGLAVEGDRDLLASAVGNLLQNAFKYTEQHTEVELRAYARGDRVLIEVEDRCGGLPRREAEEMFLPPAAHGQDRSIVGLGLSICRRTVEANNGALKVRDIPGRGCLFTIDLPRCALC